MFKSGVLRKIYLELCGGQKASSGSKSHIAIQARGNKVGLTATKFTRFALKYQLFDKRFRRPDADLLFLKISENRLMGYERFCAAFFAIALRKFGGVDELAAFRNLLRHVENAQ